MHNWLKLCNHILNSEKLWHKNTTSLMQCCMWYMEFWNFHEFLCIWNNVTYCPNEIGLSINLIVTFWFYGGELVDEDWVIRMSFCYVNLMIIGKGSHSDLLSEYILNNLLILWREQRIGNYQITWFTKLPLPVFLLSQGSLVFLNICTNCPLFWCPHRVCVLGQCT